MFLIHLKEYDVTIDGKTRLEKAATAIPLPDCQGIDDLFSRVEHFLAQLDPKQRIDLHYPLATYKVTTNHESWQGKDFNYQNFIGFDLDDVDYEQIEKYHQCVTDILGCDLHSLGVVKSGSGLHYILRVPTIESKEYLEIYKVAYEKIADTLNASLHLSGLSGKVDINVFRDKATLRLPLSERSDGSKVELINRHILPIGFTWNKWISKKEEKKLKDQTESKYRKLFGVDKSGEFTNYKDIDLESMIHGCDFLKHCRDNPKKVSYAQWFAMISTMSHAPGAEATIHAWSKDHPEYDERKTQEYIDRAKEFGKPRTCENINKHFGKCVGCPNYKKVRSPASIRPEDWIETEKTGFCQIISGKDGVVKYRPQHRDLYSFLKKSEGVIFDRSELAYKYNGRHWQEIPNFRRFLTSFAEKHFEPKQNSTVREEFGKTVMDCSYDDSVDINKDRHHFINFQNGVYDIENNVVVDHNKNFMFNYVLEYDYDAKAECPRYEQFLQEIFAGKQELDKTIDLVEEYMAYTLFGMKPDFHKSIMLIGSGSNGKSVLMDAYQSLMHPDQISNVNFGQLANDNSRSNLINKYANFSDETPKRLSDEAVQQFKAITTGDAFTAKTLYKDIMDVRGSFVKFWFSGNHLPKIQDMSEGLLRRFMIITFDNIFSVKKGNLDPQLKQKLKEERSGIFNRLLAARNRLIERNGFEIPEEVENKNNELKELNDPTELFFNEFFDFKTPEKENISSKLAYKAYMALCESEGNNRRMSSRNFASNMKTYLEQKGVCYTRKLINNSYSRVFVVGVNKDFLEEYECQHLLDKNKGVHAAF